MSCPGLGGRWGPSCHPCPLGSKKSFGGAGAAGCGAQNPPPPSPRRGLRGGGRGGPGGSCRALPMGVGWCPCWGAGDGMPQSLSLPRRPPSQPRSRCSPGVSPPAPAPALPCAAAPAGVSTRPLLSPLSPQPGTGRARGRDRPCPPATHRHPAVPQGLPQIVGESPGLSGRAPGHAGRPKHHEWSWGVTVSRDVGRVAWDRWPHCGAGYGCTAGAGSRTCCHQRVPRVPHAQPHTAQGTCPPAVPLPQHLLPLVSSHRHQLCSPPHLWWSLLRPSHRSATPS